MRKYHDVEGLSEIGLPAEKKSQTIVGMKISNEYAYLYGYEPILAVVRHVIDEDNLNSVQPDVVFHEEDNPIAVVLVEIEDHKEFKKCKKVVKGHLENYPDVKEGFAYDIDEDYWIRYTREGNEILEDKGESYSEYLGVDFSDYL